MGRTSLAALAPALLLVLAAACIVAGGVAPRPVPPIPHPAGLLGALQTGNATSTGAGSVSLLTAFLAAGGVIAIGFAAGLIFERTRVPDLLILIFLGVLLGACAVTVLGVTPVLSGVLHFARPYFSAVALRIILVDGGLNLRLS